jgi:hypothetical protein
MMRTTRNVEGSKLETSNKIKAAHTQPRARLGVAMTFYLEYFIIVADDDAGSCDSRTCTDILFLYVCIHVHV